MTELILKIRYKQKNKELIKYTKNGEGEEGDREKVYEYE